MRKLRPNADQSLDLLLDTLCNVFGSIILISCLLALLSNQQTAIPGGPTELSGAQGRLLAERIEAAKSELAGLKKLSTKMKDSGQDKLQALVQERNELQATQDRLRKLQSAQMNADSGTSKDPAGDLTELRSEVKALDQRHEDAKARKEAADKKARDLAAQIQSLRSKITAEDEKHIVHVRFPKEREVTKSAINIILKYGALYPLLDSAGEKYPGITRVMKGDEDFEAIPKKSEGIPMSNTETIRRLLASYKRAGGYVSLCVYPDSFETFRALKVLIIEAGLDYGFDVYPEHYIIIFSPKGTSPAPL
ncbi:MAG: hypothetical protein K9N47_20265 [Prosthecobacter sp.]|uniref:hypothetical protein n=1 Tax=Prosthecobacter sp. TaxID=1965333 RepID=UPI002614B55D|nr:hypothetical protein [Prosthecobacter sp.]MCF7788467.1 hypothetical protein [Prosthecobacter sp.]